MRILRQFVRMQLAEEIGRNFHTINTDPYSYRDFSDYDVDIISTVDGQFVLSVFYKNKKALPTRTYRDEAEADLAARQFVDRHRLSQAQ